MDLRLTETQNMFKKVAADFVKAEAPSHLQGEFRWSGLGSCIKALTNARAKDQAFSTRSDFVFVADDRHSRP